MGKITRTEDNADEFEDQAPASLHTNDPITEENVHLLRAGDVIQHPEWGVAQYKPRGSVDSLTGPWVFLIRPVPVTGSDGVAVGGGEREKIARDIAKKIVADAQSRLIALKPEYDSVDMGEALILRAFAALQATVPSGEKDGSVPSGGTDGAMAHTPGRWMAAAKPSYLGWPIVASPSGRMIADVAIMPKPDGETDGAWSSHYVEVEANARLIAAAPDLLEALQWFVAQKASFDERFGDQADAYYHFIKQDDAWAKTRAAIAKASPPVINAESNGEGS